MSRTIPGMLILTLILIIGAVASAGAQSKMTPAVASDVTPDVTSDVTRIAGTILGVDPAAGRFTLQSVEGTLTELHVPPTLLSRLQAGDVVEVMMAGPNAMILRRQASGPPAETTPSPTDERRQEP
jgi:hypothetical protein